MKRTLLVLFVSALFLGACSQYTCPTYATNTDDDVKKEQKEEKI